MKMALSEERLQELAKRMAAAMGPASEAPSRPQLQLVRDAPPYRRMDDITRESHCRMIRHIRRRWGHYMQRIIDHACFGLTGIDQLDDDSLVQLHMDLERAEQCMLEGISLEDAGLLRTRYA